MTEEEIKAYIKDNLSLEVCHTSWAWLGTEHWSLVLKLGKEIISTVDKHDLEKIS